jgi:hypothetical protein
LAGVADVNGFTLSGAGKSMLNGLRQKTVVQPNGTVMVQSSELPLGATVEVIVLVDPQPSESLELPLISLIGTGQGSFATHEEADRFIRQGRDLWEF